MTLNLDRNTTSTRKIDQKKDQYRTEIEISFQLELPPCLQVPPFMMSPFVTDYLKIMFRKLIATSFSNDKFYLY